MNSLIVVTFGWMFLYPVISILLITTNTTSYLYDPFWRISGIVIITALSIRFILQKKYTKRQNDFLEDFTLQSGHVDKLDFFTHLYILKNTKQVLLQRILRAYTDMILA